MKSAILQNVAIISILASGCILAAPGDTDNDGLRDEVETGSGTFVSPTATGTNPLLADSDGDSMPDGMEVSKGTDPNNAASKIRRPNIIYILTDDLGYGDLGCFWQNQRTGNGIWRIQTPKLDAMAADGAMLTHHYVGAPVCASSRSSFLLGQHQGHAAIRGVQFDKALPDNHSVASVLQSAGYHTVHIGKAGLAGTPFDSSKSSSSLEGHPLKRGFDRYFGYLTHDDGRDHYPRNGTSANKSYIHDDYTPITGANVDLYTGDAWTAFAKKTIIEDTTTHPERPFFIYLSFDTPHFYGQYPPTATYPAGGGLNGGIQWTGAPSYANTAINDPNRVDNPANNHPSALNSWYPAARKYVSMVRRIDDSVGDILQTLKDLGIDDNTLVVFTSDNGPTDVEVYPPSFESFGGFEGLKFDLWEGGLRVPTIAWWPGTVEATRQSSNIRKIARPCANWDWMATFSEMAGVPSPAFSDGTSLLPAFRNQAVDDPNRFLYFEFVYGGFTSRYPDFPNHGGENRGKMQAIRIGDYMGVRYSMASAEDPFRIYDVVKDPKQSTDLRNSLPDIEKRMMHLGISARRPGGVHPMPTETTLIPSVSLESVAGGLRCQSYEGYWPWLPEFKTLTPVSSTITTKVSNVPRSRDVDVGLAFTGYLEVPTDGPYNFTLQSDSGSSMWVHDARVIENDRGHVASKSSGAVYLSRGLHPIRIYYRHQSGDARLSLSYSGPNIPLQEIPASAFHVDGPPPPPPPQLAPDLASVKRGDSILINPFANDHSDYPLALKAVTTPGAGQTSIESGLIRYTPESQFLGRDSFEYEASGGPFVAKSTVETTVLFDNEKWFPLDESGGVTIHQIGGSGEVTGTYSGSSSPLIAWIAGRFGSALEFGGTNDIVNLPNLDPPSGSAPRTFAAWIRSPQAEAPEGQAIFSYGDTTNGGQCTIRLAPRDPAHPTEQQLRLDVGGGSITGTQTLSDGKWHHIALVIADHNEDGITNVAETRLFVDGAEEAGAEMIPQPILTGSTAIPAIGGSNLSQSMNYRGAVDDVRIFTRALSANEIADLSIAVPIGNSGQDSDGDGFSDLDELIAGTDPENSSSKFKILSFTRSASRNEISWQGVAGRTYILEESQDLKNWTAVPDVAPINIQTLTDPVSISFSDNGRKKRFFRVRVEQTGLITATTTMVPDLDGDGMTNEDEFLAGTDPQDSNSVLRMRITGSSGSSLSVAWDGVAGRTYRIEESSNLSQWTPVPDIAPIFVEQSSKGLSRLIPANGASKRFLRLAVSFSN